MKEKCEGFLLQIGDIEELHSCLQDVLENNMNKGERAYHSLTLSIAISERLSQLYEQFDAFCLSLD